MLATPLVTSEAFRSTVTLDVYQPLSLSVPCRVATDAGGVVSTRTLADCPVSMRPATSVARNSTRWVPSPSRNGPAKVVQAPPSTRYEIVATPLPASVAVNETVTSDTNQPFAPAVPLNPTVVRGGVVSTEPVLECTASMRPARSAASYWWT